MAKESGEPPNIVSSRRPARLQVTLIVLGAVIFIGTGVGLLLPAEVKWIAGLPVAAAVFLSLLATWQKTRAEESLRAESERLARAERDRSAVLFGHNVREVLNTIDGLATRNPGDRSVEMAAVRLSAAFQTKEGVSPTDARAAYFRVADLMSGSRTMAPDKVASSPERSDQFTAEFIEAAPAGSDVWEILDGRAPPAFVEDTKEQARERGTPETVPIYGTYITVRVEAGGIPFGILTVNAIKPGSLLKEETLYVQAIARILGIAELLCLTPQTYHKTRDATARRAAASAQARRVAVSQGGTG